MQRALPLLICVALVSFLFLGEARLAQAEERRVVLACNDFPPLKIEHPGTDGLKGTDVDAIADIARRAGLQIEQRFMPWKRGYAEAADGTIDGLCSCSYREDRAALFHFSDAIGQTSVGVFRRPGSTPEAIASLADLTSAPVGKIGVVKGYNLEAELDDAKVPHVTVSGDEQAYEMLANGRIDHLYSFRAPIDFIARQNGGKNAPYQELRSSPYFICLSKKRPDTAAMLPKINAAIAAMHADGTFDAIQRRYGQAPIN
ncbi:substrate-binding periplasmic protein [Dongia rigui]|uniref:Transporter substrate-binding domain-containing protein n=1 Tax=Dongia rigui TaxID=940149 RepID=A0ABU5E1P4_9PROT|nr:transporter substrate-binding domain-containing protein [Dongia rigui]MDY0873403.1 transporter substrate-binding domain-containing protein [Dongia rigui]